MSSRRGKRKAIVTHVDDEPVVFGVHGKQIKLTAEQELKGKERTMREAAQEEKIKMETEAVVASTREQLCKNMETHQGILTSAKALYGYLTEFSRLQHCQRASDRESNGEVSQAEAAMSITLKAASNDCFKGQTNLSIPQAQQMAAMTKQQCDKILSENLQNTQEVVMETLQDLIDVASEPKTSKKVGFFTTAVRETRVATIPEAVRVEEAQERVTAKEAQHCTDKKALDAAVDAALSR